MKLSNHLLKAMLITAALGLQTGCEKINLQEDLGKDQQTTETGTTDHGTDNPTSDPCPACGMG